MVLFTVEDLFDSYPADFVDLPPPEAGESCTAYIDRVGADTILRCGDTLFAFLIFELSNAKGHPGEGLRLMHTVLAELQKVQVKLLERYNKNDSVR
jgi:hypothetical protein